MSYWPPSNTLLDTLFVREYAPARPGEVQRIPLDAREANRSPGWHPTVSLDDGLACTLQWVKTCLYGGINDHSFHTTATTLCAAAIIPMLDAGIRRTRFSALSATRHALQKGIDDGGLYSHEESI